MQESTGVIVRGNVVSHVVSKAGIETVVSMTHCADSWSGDRSQDALHACTTEGPTLVLQGLPYALRV